MAKKRQQKMNAKDPQQAWFWTPEWQAGEREADEDIREGRLSGPFRSAADLKKHLSGEEQQTGPPIRRRAG